MTSENRIQFIDLAKGICITLVVLFHIFRASLIGRSHDEVPIMSFFLDDILLSFMMPFYFFLSGLFYKQYSGKYTFIIKRINKLLIPFISMFIITIVIRNLIEYAISPNYDLGTLKNDIIGLRPNTPLWFLLCLFNLNILFYLFDKMISNKIILYIAIFLLCFLGFYLKRNGISDHFYLISAFTYTPFYLCGLWIRKKTTILSHLFNHRDRLLLITSFIILFANTYFYGTKYYNGHFIIINVLNWIIGGISGSFCMILIAKYFNHLPLISYIGRYTIVVLCTHLLVIRIIYHIWPLLPPIPLAAKLFIELIVVLLISVPIIRFCIRYMPYSFAQKDVIKY